MKKYKIIYDDQDLLVVCKFAGLAVQSARVSTPDLMSLLRNEMLERGEKKPYLGLVNRLDQPVEGIVLIGKNEKAAADLKPPGDGSYPHGKWYQTVVCGKPEQREDTLVDYLLKDSRTNTSKVVKEGTPGSKRSELHYEVLASDGEKTLLRIRLLTGRHHQTGYSCRMRVCLSVEMPNMEKQVDRFVCVHIRLSFLIPAPGSGWSLK